MFSSLSVFKGVVDIYSFKGRARFVNHKIQKSDKNFKMLYFLCFSKLCAQIFRGNLSVSNSSISGVFLCLIHLRRVGTHHHFRPHWILLGGFPFYIEKSILNFLSEKKVRFENFKMLYFFCFSKLHAQIWRVFLQDLIRSFPGSLCVRTDLGEGTHIQKGSSFLVRFQMVEDHYQAIFRFVKYHCQVGGQWPSGYPS